METSQWIDILTEAKALWRLSPGATGAHALLTSGKHSDGFCNCSKIIENPAVVQKVAAGIIEKCAAQPDFERPDWVVGPAYGAVTLAYEIARQWDVKYGFTEINYTAEGKMQELARFDIPADARVLVIEDVITTGGSALKTVQALQAAGKHVMPYIGLIVNRSQQIEIEGYTLLPLIDLNLNVWDAEECPLCAAGGSAVKPKAHWDELAR